MPPLFSRPFAILSAVALALAILAFVLGAALAFTIVASVTSYLGLGRLIFTSEDEVIVATWIMRAKLGGVFALPIVVAWIAALIHRARRRTDPSPLALSIYLAVPLIGGAAATLRQVLGWKFANIPEELGLPMLFSFTDLAPDAGLTSVPLIGVALWAVVFARARRDGAQTGGG